MSPSVNGFCVNDEPRIQRAAYKYPDLVSEEKEGEISE